MARTMDERCQILREKLQGKFYKKISDYEGYAFLRAWEWKMHGEAGRLWPPSETTREWRESAGPVRNATPEYSTLMKAEHPAQLEADQEKDLPLRGLDWVVDLARDMKSKYFGY